MNYWWLSFTDADRPEGERFLGAAMVFGDTLGDALAQSWAAGINPGGAVLAAGPFALGDIPAEQPLGVLLTRDQIAAVDAAVLG